MTTGRILFCCVLFALTLLPGLALAQSSPRWTFVEGGAIRVDPDDLSADNGWYVGASVGIKSFHIIGEFDGLDFNRWELGGGWHGLLGKKADLVAEGTYLDADIDDGFRLSVGVRWMVLDPLEISFYVNHTNLDLTDATALEINAIWTFDKIVGVGGGIEYGDEGNTGRLFVRFTIK